MVLSCRRMPEESRKKGNSCLFPMKTFTEAVILRRVYPVKLVSASHSLRETHCDNVAFEHHGLSPSGCLQLKAVWASQEFRECSLPGCMGLPTVTYPLPENTPRPQSGISHRHHATISCQMHFLTLCSISHWLPANTPAQCDYAIFFHPLWLDCVAAKQAVDTEPEVLFLDYPFLSHLYLKMSIAQT